MVEGTVLVPFNDVDALARALERRDVALVLTEPAMTNNNGLILPDEGFHADLRRITRETGTLLACDETHTQVVGPGGLTAAWGLEPDLVTIGKSIAGGVPFGAWGMTDAIADLLRQEKGPDGERADLVATGGTLFGNALSMAAARATMLEILTPEAYASTQRLGARLATGMRAAVERTGLPWHIHHLGPRSGYTFRPTPVRNADGGPRLRRRAPGPPDPGLAGEPRCLGGDRGCGTRLLDPGDRRGRRRLRRRLGRAAGGSGRLTRRPRAAPGCRCRAAPPGAGLALDTARPWHLARRGRPNGTRRTAHGGASSPHATLERVG